MDSVTLHTLKIVWIAESSLPVLIGFSVIGFPVVVAAGEAQRVFSLTARGL
jgi:hypothetical protein